jgi:2'-hydroxyisoflavone reductase
MGRLFDECRAVSGSDAEPVWVDADFLVQSGVTPWTELPLWVPEVGEYAGFMRVDCSKAYAAGLTFRPLEDTVRATLEWDSKRPQDVPRRAGLDSDREQALLRAWRARA